MRAFKEWAMRNYWKFLIPGLLVAVAAYARYAPEYQLPGFALAVDPTVQLVSEFVLFLAMFAVMCAIAVGALAVVVLALCLFGGLLIMGGGYDK